MDNEKIELYMLLDEIIAYIKCGVSVSSIKECSSHEDSFMFQAEKALKKWNGLDSTGYYRKISDTVN